MANKRLLPCVLAVAAIVLALTGAAKSDSGGPEAVVTATNVKLTPAQRRNIRLYSVVQSKFRKVTETSGVVDFDNDQATGVLAPFSGPVSRLLVSLGERVKRGDPLALVDSPDFAAAISAYRKGLITARTLRRLADLDKDLIQHQGISRREQEQAESDAVNAEADRDAALQALISLNVDAQTIKDIEEGRPLPRPSGIIRSPITGTVVEKLITPGELLQAGTTPCFTVADLSRVWVLAQVFGPDVESVHLGDRAQVLTGVGSTRFSGTVDNIAGEVDPNTRSVAVRVVVDNPQEILKKQMYLRVLIQSRDESTGLLVPVATVLRDDENLPFVYLVQLDGSFARAHVSLDYRSGDQYEITDGLKAGDQVVVDGGVFMQFMQAQ
jgi:cobalt-zinc-cadmium efflux system membrane fusion protein